MDCQDDWVDMNPMMMGSHRHTVHSTTNIELSATNIEPSAILLGRKPTLSTDMLLRSDDYLNRELQDEEIEEIENRNYTEILKQLNLVQESVFNTTSQNISMAQVSQKKYYNIRHSRNFKFTKNDIVIKFLPRNSQRKGGKLDDKFSGPYVIDKIMDLGITRLHTLKGKVLKKGVPIKQLQKYNKKADEGNYSNTSSETENEDQPRKRRRLSSDAESSMSNVDVMSGSVHHVDSNTMSKKHEKQEATLSVKQSVTRNTVNDKESFTRTPTNTTYNKKKIRLTPMISPITQIKGGIKKLQPHKRKFFFQLSTDEKEKMEMEIELCITLPDLDDENEDKVCVELCDMLDTLPDIPVPVQNNQQTDRHERQKTTSEPEIQETVFLKAILFFFFQSLTAHEEI